MRRLLFCILVASLSSAAALGMSGSIGSSGTASIAVGAEFPDSWGEEECLVLSGQPAAVTVKDRTGLVVSHEARQSGNYTLVCATVPSDYLRFEITSDSFTAKEGPLWAFGLSLGLSENISALNATLSLPPGATLKSTNGAVSGEGGTLTLIWSAEGIDTLHRAHLRAGYELSGQENGLLLPAAFALIAAAAYALLRKRGPGPAAGRLEQDAAYAAKPLQEALESNAVFKTLDETDRELLREIAAQGGKTTQAHLNLRTHVPKATLSRRLASLENRGIIRKSQKGNRNLITLGGALEK